MIDIVSNYLNSQKKSISEFGNIQTTNFNLEPNKINLVNTSLSLNGLTCMLPTGVLSGTKINITDSGNTFSLEKPLTILNNGYRINGVLDDFQIQVGKSSISLMAIDDGGTELNWILMDAIPLFSNTNNVLQVVSATKTDVFSAASATTNNFVPVTGLSVTITPRSITSRILIIADVNASQSVTATIHLRLYRNSTIIGSGISAGSRLGVNALYRPAGDQYGHDSGNMAMSFMDNHNLNTPIIYQVYISLGATYSGTMYVNRTKLDTDADYGGRTSSTITAFEVL